MSLYRNENQSGLMHKLLSLKELKFCLVFFDEIAIALITIIRDLKKDMEKAWNTVKSCCTLGIPLSSPILLVRCARHLGMLQFKLVLWSLALRNQFHLLLFLIQDFGPKHVSLH